MTNFGKKVKPTRGEVLRLKRRLAFLLEGLEVLSMKRDKLALDLQVALENISIYKKELEEKLLQAYGKLITAYIVLGQSEIETQAESVQGGLKVKVLPMSIMGTLVPRIDVISHSNIEGKIGTIEYGVAKRFIGLLDNLIRVAEKEDEIIRVAQELNDVNSKVNALEKAVIPIQEAEIKFIEEKLEEEELEDLTRMKIIRNSIVRRRS
ncbi:MAG: V-type ATP synthase subunit D [Candidatus Bathyarchaeota archaeon]|jgi:H(+)-transporting ATP synthase subunit D